MAYGERKHAHGTIRTYWPDDTDTEFYIEGSASLVTIIERARAKWPNTCDSRFQITPEHIHTDCLGYDLYDAGDWTYFLKISLKD